MLTSLNRLIGMPVIWQDQNLGSVERGVTDAQARRLWGVIVRRGIGMARWIPSEAVMLIGNTCVLARQRPESLPDELPEDMNEVYLTSGEKAGHVTDGVLDGLTLRLRALEVSSGLFYQLMGSAAYAMRYHVFSSGDGRGRVVAPELLTRAEFQRRMREEDKQ